MMRPAIRVLTALNPQVLRHALRGGCSWLAALAALLGLWLALCVAQGLWDGR